jgi:hypothetical protein
MLCIGGVLLPAGSPASVSSTRKATSPFLYFHTSRFYLLLNSNIIRSSGLMVLAIEHEPIIHATDQRKTT